MARLAHLRRRLRAELMDQPGLDAREHRRALAALRRINLASAVSGVLWREIAHFASANNLRRLRLLDVASGGGDVALRLWQRARRSELELDILGLDVSPVACQFASQRCAVAGDGIRFAAVDVCHNDIPGVFDVAICSLFMHHLPAEQAVALLQKMAAASRLVLVSDLRRSLAGYLLAHAACRVLTRSPIVRSDAPQSVVNAFSVEELRALCDAAGLAGASVRNSWPCRMLVRYEAPALPPRAVEEASTSVLTAATRFDEPARVAGPGRHRPRKRGRGGRRRVW